MEISRQPADCAGLGGDDRPHQLLVLSASTPEGLGRACSDLADFFQRNSEVDLADAAYTLQVERSALGKRCVLVCRTPLEAAQALAGPNPKQVLSISQQPAERSPVFLLPGQGGHHAGMAAGLYRRQPVFRKHLARCAELLGSQFDLLGALYPDSENRRMTQMSASQPALFAVEYALARLWMSWGLRPGALIGHSIGEFVAACLAGVFSLRDGLALMAARGRLSQRMPQGAMLAVPLPEPEAQACLRTGLSLAAVNGPSLCVLSGPIEAVDSLQAKLSQQGLHCRRLKVDRALHSRCMAPAAEPFLEEIRKVRMSPPRIPLISTIEGDWMTPSQAVDPLYWVRNLTETVRFAPALGVLFGDSEPPGLLLLEVGPQTLAALARRHPGRRSTQLVFPSLPLPQARIPDEEFVLKQLGQLWLSGAEVNWEGLHAPSPRRRIPLPTGFDRIEADSPAEASSAPMRIRHTSETEERLAKLWRELFELEQVDVDDNFFDLGGHSLQATQAMVSIREEFGLDLPLRLLFEAPTIAELAQQLEAAARTAPPPPIQPVERTAEMALSFGQQRLWLLDQLVPGNPAYNSPLAWRIKGPLDGGVLEGCLNELRRRHETLRTHYGARAGRPYQSIRPFRPQPLPLIDLTGLKEAAEREDQARRRAEARRPFNLSSGPLFRAALIRLGPRCHDLLLTLHHSISDGWSKGLLRKELSRLYEASLQGRPSPLAWPPVQYADFAVWQRGWIQGEVLDALLAYWEAQLKGAAVLEMPTDRPRPPIPEFRGGSLNFLLPASQVKPLQGLARRRGATLYMALLSAFQALLHRCTGQTDIVVGSPIANRNYKGTEGLIGFLANTLAMRGDLSGNPSFVQLLDRSSETTLQAYAHQDIPFEKLVDHLRVERDWSRNPIFQIAFTFQNTPPQELQLSKLELESLPVDSGAVRFDLALQIQNPDSSGMQGALAYDAGLFDRTTVQRLVGQFAGLLGEIVQRPDQPISRLPLLSSAQLHQALLEWGGGDEPLRELRIHRLFEEQAAAKPERVALTWGEHSLSYGELNGRANRLAHGILRFGLPLEGIVAVCMPRCLETVLSLLAVLKSGAAYLPLDPAYPRQRLSWMLQDSRARLALSNRQGHRNLPIRSASQIQVDSQWPDLAGEIPSNPAVPADADSAAYLMYTSGSTGQPKGVIAVHRGVARLVRRNDFIDFSGRQVFSQLATISFDAATREIWGALLNGGRLALMPDSLTPDEVGPVARRCCVSTLSLPAALFNRLSEDQLGLLRGVEQLLCGGDVMSSSHARLALRRLPGLRLVNCYGPTEATTNAVTHAMTRAEDAASRIPIGRPINNTRAFVTGRYRELVPVGAVGELWIGGAGLSRGYWRRPKLTALKFAPCPFGDQPGARLYRSGDLVRWLADGRLQFLRRTDNQVKVRGFRVEPAEVEAALQQHPIVCQTAVSAWPEPSGDKRLAAYYVLRQAEGEAAGADSQSLWSYLQERLPSYLIPSNLIRLDQLPLTPSGKLDRQALPRPDQNAHRSRGFVAPRNRTEARLARIWREVLQIDRVGALDRFLELGGHSLLAAQVVSEVRQKFRIDLPLRAIFECPDLASLASRIQQASPEQLPPAIAPADRTQPLPLSFAQQRLWFLDRLTPDNPFYNVTGAWQLSGRLSAAALHKSLQQVVSRHEALRTRFPSRGGRPLQVISPPAPLPLPIADLSRLGEGLRESETRRLGLSQSRQPFDLACGPLIRTLLLHLSEEESLLLLSMHHIISDAWSKDVLLTEMMELYRWFAQGQARPFPLRKLSIQYADFALWQRNWLQGEALQLQIDFWKQHLQGAQSLRLPADRPRPAVQTFRGGSVPADIPNQLSGQLRSLSRTRGVTLHTLLLAAFQALLYRNTGQTDIVVGIPIANRSHPETKQLIGFFVNTLALRCDLSGDPAFEGLLARTSDESLEAYAYQDLPFEKLVEQLKPERDLSRNPIFQAMLAFQADPRQALKMAGLEVRRLPLRAENTRFDMELHLRDGQEGIAGVLAYDRDLFDLTTMARLAGQFLILLQSAAADPSRSLSQMPLLSEAQRHQMTLEWNPPRNPRPGELAHRLCEAQAAQNPDASAAVQGDSWLSYGCLDKRADSLSQRLAAGGITLGSRVAVCLSRGLEATVAILGILKAGACYVPLDPSYPEKRLKLMLRDSQSALLAADTSGAPSLPGGGPPVILAGGQQEPEGGARRLNLPIQPGHLAYLIYTSGSTGKPKAVAMTHGALAGMLHYQRRARGFEHAAPLIQFASLSFDVSVQEVFTAWATGGTLVSASQEARQDPSLLLDLLGQHQAERLFVPFVALKQLAEAGLPRSRRMGALRQVVTAGEQLLLDHSLREWFDRMPQCTLTNQYGPTESHIATALALQGDPKGWPTLPPIGRLLEHARGYVLDSSLQPVPIGAAGQLFIAGRGLARGYWTRPSLSAGRFIPDPFSLRPGERMYSSGDLVRFLADGSLEFLGRADHQVKVRGFRVEPGEVEAALAEHPSVLQAAVAAHPGPSGNLRLVGYVTTHAPAESLQEISSWLSDRLPAYMVPSILVALQSLPLTPSGKLDRKSLPAPGEGALGSRDGAAPRNQLEARLVRIWKEILGVGQVGVHDDFFELGGHSLLATRMVSRIHQEFHCDLPLRALFEKPTAARLARRIEQASVHHLPPVQAVSRGGGLPLSFAQQRLWFLHSLTPRNPFYNIAAAWRVIGRLDADALRRSLGLIVQRHETLRTRFPARNGSPVQVIDPAAELLIPCIDLRAAGAARRQAAVVNIPEELAKRPFDLHSGPLLRAALLQLGDKHWALLMTMHHIVSDGWSIKIFLRELAKLYKWQAAGGQGDCPLAPLPIQYADFAVWQRKRLLEGVLSEQLDFWKSSLKGAQVLQLPADRPRPAVQAFRGGRCNFELTQPLTRRLMALSRRHGATHFMTFLAAFLALVHRSAGQDDVVVGTPIANRNHSQTEGLIGFFVNTLAMRADLSGDPTFEQHLGRVIETCLQAYSHQDLPFERLVEQLQVERDLSRNPIFQVIFSYQESPLNALQLPGLEVSPLTFKNFTTRFDMVMNLTGHEQGIKGFVTFDRDLFDATSVIRLLRRFERLLEGLADDPEQRLSEIPLLSPVERQQITEWAGEKRPLPSPPVIFRLFEDQSEQCPDASAVVCGDAWLSFAGLNARANRLARFLGRRSVGPDCAVGLCLGRCLQLPEALIGILKAGGAFLPLEPDFPARRLQFMVEDAGAKTVLTRRERADALPQPRCVGLDSNCAAIALEESLNPDRSIDGDNLAYLMYTSGSTGRPKGVAVTHRNVVRLVRGNSFAAMDRGQVYLHFAPFSFDASTLEIWGPLLNGGRLAIAPAGNLSLHELGSFIEQQAVSTAWLTAGLFHQMVQEHLDGLRPLSQLLAGGDVLAAGPVQMVLEELHGVRLVNGYGPTESTTFACCCGMQGRQDLSGSVPIGRPIVNSQAYVADPQGRAAPPGTPGELWIGGMGLARGYLGRPSLTAERFWPNPFGKSGSRIYRSGDLVRHLADGRLQFLGRIDHQVKLRGFRVEPAEVEALIMRHPQVLQAAVTAQDGRLVAYVVGRGEGNAGPPSAQPPDLRSYLEARLPAYMVPWAFLRLERLPLNENGKLDRRALPAPDRRSGQPQACLAPRTPAEAKLVRIWREILEVDEVGACDDFFQLGGHSLLATRLISQIRREFKVELPLRAIFEAPRLEGLAERIQSAGATSVPPIARTSERNHLPLSFAQQRMWFLQRLTPSNPFYHVRIVWQLDGDLNLAALRRSMDAIMERHEILRTCYPESGGVAVQRILPQAALPLPLLDLSGVPAAGQEGEAQRLSKQEEGLPLDLIRGPVIRASLVRMAPSRHRLSVTMHHIASDGWSLGVFLQDLTVLYQAFCEGLPSPLAPLEVQYADFALWQRRRLQDEVLEKQLSYWARQLADAPVLDLPADRTRPAVQAFRGGRLALRFSQELSDGLNALSRGRGVTLYMTLLAAFQVLLHRYSGQDDVVVGTPVANRTHRELEGLIGFFVNSLVMRGDLSGDPSFTEHLERVSRTALDAYAHQDLPFEKLVEHLQPERDLSRNPVFQVVIALQNLLEPIQQAGGLKLRHQPSQVRTTRFDLELLIVETSRGLRGVFNYDRDLFYESTIRRMADQFRVLLAGIAADPQQPISRLPMLGEAERRQLNEWGIHRRPMASPALAHRLVEDQAARHPDRVAVVCEENQFSYAQLNAWANQMARWILRHGVHREDCVGVSMGRCLELPLANLSILKAGNAYLPLDTSYPQERLGFMLSNADAPLLLALRQQGSPWLSQGAKLADLASAWQEVIQQGESNLDLPLDDESLACVMYTSGSTGQPKGVALLHQGIARVAKDGGLAYRNSGQVMLQMSSTSFDASILEVWGPLLNGGRLAILPDGRHSLHEISRAMARYGASIAWLTAGLFHQMVDESPDLLRPLRQLLTGGDIVSPDRVEKTLEELGGLCLVDGYGPTENCTFTACHPMRLPQKFDLSVPIGRPIPNTRLCLMDRNWRMAPAGVPAELWIGGRGLARGYINQPGRTAEKFVPDPLGEPGSRLYRSGDLGRFMDDGTLLFLGRIDQQVKVRGFRIEPGEIEAALDQYPTVRETAVLALPDRFGSKRLVAYVAPEEGAEFSASELEGFLGEMLPPYMLPSLFVSVDHLPLSANGKLDRRALPEPTPDSERKQEYVAPRDAIELRLAAIWREVLEVDRVGAFDNFFELGGHSLLATQAVSKIRSAFGLDLPLQAIFEAPRLSGLAGRIQRAFPKAPAPPIQPRRREGKLPLSFAQQRLWFLERLAPGNAFYNIPSAWRLIGRLDLWALQSSLNEIVQRHEDLRTCFPEEKGEPWQEILPRGELALPLVDLSSLAAAEKESEARRLSVFEARRPFDLRRGPVARAILIRIDSRQRESDHRLLITMHHIVSDGWSMGVFLDELATLYEWNVQRRRSRLDAPFPLPALPIQYADFALWQRDWLRGEVLEEQISYWERRLKGITPLSLPTDRPRPAMQNFRGERVSFRLPLESAERLRSAARNSGATLYMTLLAGLYALLHHYSGQSDILVGTPIANRNHPGIEKSIGFFVNSLAMRADLSGNPRFSQLLEQVVESTLDAYEHQDLPFEKLVEQLQPERDLSRNPLFQVMILLQNAPSVTLRMADVQALPQWGEARTTRFDLEFHLWENARDGISGFLFYDQDLFHRTTMLRLRNHFRALLQGFADDTSRRIRSLPLLTAAETAQALHEWNDSRSCLPERCMHELFEEQAGFRPDAAAISCQTALLSYGEMNRRANRLAHALRGQGVGPEVMVAIHMDRSIELIQAMAAVLKAGGSYLPIDLNQPPKRVSYMLEDSRPAVLLAQAAIDCEIAGCSKLAVQDGSLDLALSAQPEKNPSPWAASENRAYAIYTSGSTGQPKGVEVGHRALANLSAWHSSYFGMGPGALCSQFAAPGFDASVSEIWTALGVGACLVVVPASMRSSPAQVVDWLRRSKIDACFLPTPLAEEAIQEGWPEGTVHRAVYAAGDRLHRSALKVVPSNLFNLYGPTENTVCTSYAKVVEGGSDPPIGRPIANVQVYLLNPSLQPLPVGVSGEMCIGGDSLARGYIGQPAQTAACFVPNPFAQSPGERLYRSGDLARRRNDGQIEFQGRIDQQVKVRGFRIETAEVERALGEFPGVQQACVVAVQAPAGGVQLLAYLAAGATESQIPFDDLSRFLKERLPDYMVPPAFLQMERLPLTANGKVDRKALPDPGLADAGRQDSCLPPRNRFEEELARIWRDLLGVERVGVRDDFFRLGGHSLLAVKMLSRVCESFQVDLSLSGLFQDPTIEGVAAAVAELCSQGAAGPSAAQAQIIPQPEDAHLPFPLTDVQQAYWVGRTQSLELGNVASHGYMEWDFPELDADRLEKAWQSLINRHGMLRAVFLPDGRQRVLAEVPHYLIQRLDLRFEDDQEKERRLALLRQRMSQQVLPADRWPLFEIRVSLLAKDRIRLHFQLDGLLADARSLQILFRELWQLYQEPSASLPQLEIGFRDYVLTEEAFKRSESYRNHLEYWNTRIETLPPGPELPLARSPGSLQRPRFVMLEYSFKRDMWDRVKDRGNRAGAAPSAVLLAAFAEVLAQWSRHPRFTLNLTLFNRPQAHPQIDQVVGDFTSLILLECDMTAAEPFETRVRNLQKQLWQDLDHRHVSGVRVLRELIRSRRGSFSRALMPIVFSSLLGMQEAQAGQDSAPGGGGKLVYGKSETPQVWIDHAVSEFRGGLKLRWAVVEELFPSGLISGLFAEYCRLLKRLAESEQAWKQKNYRFDQAAGEQTLQAQAAAMAAKPPSQRLEELFLAQAARNPSKTALLAPGKVLTYGQLERLACNLGRILGKQGAQPGSLIAVFMEKGWEQVAAVLGILCSGAAYLPIDPALPQERVEYLLENGLVSLALTQPHLSSRLPAMVGQVVITEDCSRLEADIQRLPPQDPASPAYVIYTSGSTGRPKGVMIDHEGAVNTIADINRRFDVGPADRVLALSALNFDLSVYDVFGTLAAGATIVLPDPAGLRDPSHWIDCLQENGVTVWNSVPALLQMLVDYASSRGDLRVASLRLAMLSGDWIPVALPDQARKLAGEIELISLGGATEASIWSIFYPIQQVDPNWKSIPYGRPLSGQSIYVLDSSLRIRPVWVPGELYIGGKGLALGYWREGSKTASSFLPHPQNGRRLYRTGDWGRYLPSGDIEFLGREDLQVKIQGHRIELGEIEAALRLHPQVESALVQAPGGPLEGRRLVAYLVPRKGAPSGEGCDTEEGLPAESLPQGRPALQLPDPQVDQATAPLGRCQAARRFAARPVALSELAALLGRLSGIQPDGLAMPKYRYASGGSAYPVQAYLSVKPGRVQGLAAGAYYYHPLEHRLVELSQKASIEAHRHAPAFRQAFEESAFTLLLTAKLGAVAPLYPETAREFCYLEAGYMSQLLMTSEAGLQLGLCPAYGLGLEGLESQFGLQPDHEVALALLGGPLPLAGNSLQGSDAASPEDLNHPCKPHPARQVPRPLRDPLERMEFKLSRANIRRLEGHSDVHLPAPALDEELKALYAARRSYRNFLQELIPLQELGRFVGRLRQMNTGKAGVRSSLYPSAGGLCPVQVFLYVKAGRVEGISQGTFRYLPLQHALQMLSDSPLKGGFHSFNMPIYERSAFAVFLVAEPAKADPHNPLRGMDLCLIEAGAMAQLLMTQGGGDQIGLCPLGGMNFEEVRPSLALGQSFQLIHLLLGGRVAPLEASRLDALLAPDPMPAGKPEADLLPEAPQERTPPLTAGQLSRFLQEKLPGYMLPSAYVFLQSFPLGPNGKVDRKALPPPDETRLQTRETVGRRLPRDEVEKALAEIWGQVLGIDEVGIDDDFLELGGDSIQVIQAVNLCFKAGYDVSPRQIFEKPTVAAIACLLRPRLRKKQDGRSGPAVALTPLQKHFLKMNSAQLERFCQSRALPVPSPADPAVLETALAALLQAHPALRARLDRRELCWRPTYSGLPRLPLIDLSLLPRRRQAMTGLQAAIQLQRSLNLEQGLLLQAALLRPANGERDRLLMLAHRLCVDEASWKILREDLLSASRPGSGPAPEKAGLSDWLKHSAPQPTGQSADANGPYPEPALLALAPEQAGTGPARASKVSQALSGDEFKALLEQVPKAYRTRTIHVLLAALAQAAAGFAHDGLLKVDLEVDGREQAFGEMDFARTVGWFGERSTLLLEARAEATPAKALAAIKESLHSAGKTGFENGQAAESKSAEMLFCYIEDSASRSGFDPADPDGLDGILLGDDWIQSPYLVEVRAVLGADFLRTDWICRSSALASPSIDRLTTAFQEALSGLIEHCLSPEAGAALPSDFPLMDLDQEGLARLVSQIEDPE